MDALAELHNWHFLQGLWDGSCGSLGLCVMARYERLKGSNGSKLANSGLLPIGYFFQRP